MVSGFEISDYYPKEDVDASFLADTLKKDVLQLFLRVLTPSTPYLLYPIREDLGRGFAVSVFSFRVRGCRPTSTLLGR